MLHLILEVLLEGDKAERSNLTKSKKHEINDPIFNSFSYS